MKHDLTVAGRYENVPKVAQFVADSAEEAGLDSKAVFHCQMAVDEACTNIIEHAYGGEDIGDIQVSTHVANHSFYITLVDSGNAFDPESVPQPRIESDPLLMEPGGLGLHLMKKVMDEVQFTFNKGKNQLVMVKRLTLAPSMDDRP